MAYSIAAIPTWLRAVILMPTTAIVIMSRLIPVAMPTLAQVFVGEAPNTASTDGPSTSTPLRVPRTYPAIISQPVTNPRYGLIARPTHSNEAPLFAFHMLRRRSEEH